MQRLNGASAVTLARLDGRWLVLCWGLGVVIAMQPRRAETLGAQGAAAAARAAGITRLGLVVVQRHPNSRMQNPGKALPVLVIQAIQKTKMGPKLTPNFRLDRLFYCAC